MLFEIHRASDDSDESPCEEARKVCRPDAKGGDYWQVEINTIEELVAFSKKYGNLVFDPRSIWIYDDYME